jgi:hypothetical protein
MPQPPFQPYYGYPPPFVFAPPTPSSNPAASIQPSIRQTNQTPMRLPSTASEHSNQPMANVNLLLHQSVEHQIPKLVLELLVFATKSVINVLKQLVVSIYINTLIIEH